MQFLSALFRFPKDDPAQATRARHTLMSSISSLTIISFTVYCSHVGLFRVPLPGLFGFVALALAIHALFYAAICAGWNRRLADPSMTLVQIINSILWMMFVLYFIEQVRGTVLMLFMIIFVFGIFRLRLAQFIGAAVFALGAYAIVIALLFFNRPQSINARIEVLQWVLLAMVLPWFALIGAYISNIRNALRQKNKELEKALETIERLASHDELTGIPNRRCFLDALRREQACADRDHRPFCLALFDLDFFKAINDRHGHLAGDHVLRAFAECVQKKVRQTDYFGRYGGEEFALLIVDADMDLASNMLERIRADIEDHAFSHIDRKVTASIGVAQYAPGETINSLINRADQALYGAKNDGRNCVKQAVLEVQATNIISAIEAVS
ncbi:GGDEF domain-containing protein [Janthinobacterium sp. 17J80-10]|uniref:GGDEF domain-containing protein n=1 Tax=Janthinobacterium sp. 17J80-10 TaxID=2497863 RepID=UPI0010057C17|nr:GGDEF domain-containing protein [Janthinobacterium sp. 17J80-10]QAU33143.1 diguanylate cyclase [Janthinobacterium sp. 17J80-10]